MNLGLNLKTLRTAKSISQKELAKELGITPTYLSLIENGSKKPSLTLIEKFARVLEIPLALVFSELTFN
jgi:transcriptional regulator with XRE-family HTH domain